MLCYWKKALVSSVLRLRKHFCFILSTGTKIRIDSVMRPRSSSRGCNTSASVTVKKDAKHVDVLLMARKWRDLGPDPMTFIDKLDLNILKMYCVP